MKSKYIMGLMCAFCFGVLGKTALDAVGYQVVSSARAEVAGMNSRDLSRDRDFVMAVESLIYGIVPGIIQETVAGNCSVYVDGSYGYIDC
ncbi:hypothetical protein N8067_00315 [Planktomarina temperata]|nr:hypothetical protein [Planktomarina temperata]MDC1258476.1 hypothetical protein [Planktomarina temperata]